MDEKENSANNLGVAIALGADDLPCPLHDAAYAW
jgi:hypothetical protein